MARIETNIYLLPHKVVTDIYTKGTKITVDDIVKEPVKNAALREMHASFYVNDRYPTCKHIYETMASELESEFGPPNSAQDLSLRVKKEDLEYDHKIEKHYFRKNRIVYSSQIDGENEQSQIYEVILSSLGKIK